MTGGFPPQRASNVNMSWLKFTVESCYNESDLTDNTGKSWKIQINGILPKGPYPPCLRMADRTLLAGYARNMFPQNSSAYWGLKPWSDSADYICELLTWWNPNFPKFVHLYSQKNIQLSSQNWPIMQLSAPHWYLLKWKCKWVGWESSSSKCIGFDLEDIWERIAFVS